MLFFGLYGLRRLQVGSATRVMLGMTVLFSGVALSCLIFDQLMQSPVRFGFCIPLIGLGLNQATVPLRAVAGRAD
jgi:hypothetical protein